MLERVEAFADHIDPSPEVNWNVVEFIVSGYRARHPEEFAGCVEHVQMVRKTLKNRYAEASAQSSMRQMFALPPNLEFALSKKYPLIFKGENLIRFLKLFPMFQIPDVL